MEFPRLSDEFFSRPIPLVPVFSPRPWGADNLRRVLDKPTPAGSGPIGESWELSDHPDGRSKVGGDSPAAGRFFGDLLRAHPRPMLGADQAPAKFPMLVKYIDAAGDLSVQVHPDDAWCRDANHPDRGKSECWYVMDCKPGTEIIYGFHEGVTEQQARAAFASGRFMDLLRRVPIAPGDFITVPPRTVHAMLAGTLICEIQQSSNTTFRLYDWDRQPPRPLHIDESFAVSEFDPRRLPPVQHLGPLARRTPDAPDTMRRLLRNEFFSVWLYELWPDCSVRNVDLVTPHGTIVNIVVGSGTFNCPGGDIPFRRGETWFFPAAAPNPGIEAGPGGARLLFSSSEEIR